MKLRECFRFTQQQNPFIHQNSHRVTLSVCKFLNLMITRTQPHSPHPLKLINIRVFKSKHLRRFSKKDWEKFNGKKLLLKNKHYKSLGQFCWQLKTSLYFVCAALKCFDINLLPSNQLLIKLCISKCLQWKCLTFFLSQ